MLCELYCATCVPFVIREARVRRPGRRYDALDARDMICDGDLPSTVETQVYGSHADDSDFIGRQGHAIVGIRNRDTLSAVEVL